MKALEDKFDPKIREKKIKSKQIRKSNDEEVKYESESSSIINGN